MFKLEGSGMLSCGKRRLLSIRRTRGLNSTKRAGVGERRRPKANPKQFSRKYNEDICGKLAQIIEFTWQGFYRPLKKKKSMQCVFSGHKHSQI